MSCSARGFVALGAVAAALVGCPPPGAPDPSPAAIVIDGALDDWPDERTLRADGHDLYVRLGLPDEITLQAAPYSVVLLLDVDGDASTGSGLDDVEGDTADAGAEVAVVFSPPGGRPRRGGPPDEGVAALVLPTGEEATRPLSHEALDLVFAPTYAAKDFEVRLSRRVHGQPAISSALAAGRVAVRMVAVGRNASLLWSKPLGSVELPPLADPGERLATAWPARPADALRVVSWNVLFATPRRRPKPFARILRALDPDIVLVQEWERADREELRAWFRTNVSDRWHALDSPGWGVAVIAQGALRRLGPERIERPDAAPPDTFRPDQAMRLAAAVVETRFGPVAVASMHLKCCGPTGGPQDRARIAEAEVIRDTLSAALRAQGAKAPRLRIFGGDLNLVGSRRPVDVLRGGLGVGGADLDVARTEVPGDRAVYTWRGSGSRYAPGRLDFLVYGGGEEVQAFALDTARLSDATLRAAGVERGDSAASDHLPLVLDIRPAPDRSATEPG